MSKCGNQKLKILYLLQLLYDKSDQTHPVTMEQMLAYLAENGVAAERKSLYSDIEALRSFGVNVVLRKSKPSGYYLEGSRGKRSRSNLIGRHIAGKPRKNANAPSRPVELECGGTLAPAVAKSLGGQTAPKPGANGLYHVAGCAAITPQFYAWLFYYGEEVRLLAPPDAVEHMQAQLQRALALYS